MKKPTKKDRAWFERKVAELGGKLDKLPTARQERLEQIWEDNPLSDGPFTPQQEEFFERMMEERQKAKAAEEQSCRPSRMRSKGRR